MAKDKVYSGLGIALFDEIILPVRGRIILMYIYRDQIQS